MKRIILMLTVVVMFACGGNQSQQQKADNQATTEESAEATETEVIEAEDCIMEKVITLLPQDVLPNGMKGMDLLTEMKKKSEGPDGSYDILCDYSYFDVTMASATARPLNYALSCARTVRISFSSPPQEAATAT